MYELMFEGKTWLFILWILGLSFMTFFTSMFMVSQKKSCSKNIKNIHGTGTLILLFVITYHMVSNKSNDIFITASFFILLLNLVIHFFMYVLRVNNIICEARSKKIYEEPHESQQPQNN